MSSTFFAVAIFYLFSFSGISVSSDSSLAYWFGGSIADCLFFKGGGIGGLRVRGLKAGCGVGVRGIGGKGSEQNLFQISCLALPFVIVQKVPPLQMALKLSTTRSCARCRLQPAGTAIFCTWTFLSNVTMLLCFCLFLFIYFSNFVGSFEDAI